MHQCPFEECDESFVEARDLWEHGKVHIAWKNPYQCWVCKERFRDELTIQQHYHSNHSPLLHMDDNRMEVQVMVPEEHQSVVETSLFQQLQEGTLVNSFNQQALPNIEELFSTQMQLTSQEQFYTDQTMDTKQLGQFIEQLEQNAAVQSLIANSCDNPKEDLDKTEMTPPSIFAEEQLAAASVITASQYTEEQFDEENEQPTLMSPRLGLAAALPGPLSPIDS